MPSSRKKASSSAGFDVSLLACMPFSGVGGMIMLFLLAALTIFLFVSVYVYHHYVTRQDSRHPKIFLCDLLKLLISSSVLCGVNLTFIAKVSDASKDITVRNKQLEGIGWYAAMVIFDVLAGSIIAIITGRALNAACVAVVKHAEWVDFQRRVLLETSPHICRESDDDDDEEMSAVGVILPYTRGWSSRSPTTTVGGPVPSTFKPMVDDSEDESGADPRDSARWARVRQSRFHERPKPPYLNPQNGALRSAFIEFCEQNSYYGKYGPNHVCGANVDPAELEGAPPPQIVFTWWYSQLVTWTWCAVLSRILCGVIVLYSFQMIPVKWNPLVWIARSVTFFNVNCLLKQWLVTGLLRAAMELLNLYIVDSFNKFKSKD